MSAAAALRMADARAAIELVAAEGLTLILRARDGPVRAGLLDQLSDLADMLRITADADATALAGGVDVMASVSAGQQVHARSLAERLDGRVLLVAGADRIGDRLAALLARRLDSGHLWGLVLLDESEPGEAMTDMLGDRAAMLVDLDGLSMHDLALPTPVPDAIDERDSDIVAALCEVAAVLGIASLRAPSHALAVARGCAGLEARETANRSDIERAVRLTLAPRARRFPAEQPPPADEAQTPPDQDQPDGEQDAADGSEQADRLIEAAKVALPAGLLETGTPPPASGGAALAGSADSRTGGGVRGRRGRLRKALPDGGARLDLAATLIAAAPMQRLRGRERGARLAIRKDDIRVRRPVPQRRRATIFAVDASGSAAMARLAEVKGAVEQLLGESYVRRDEVGLIAFRGTAAQTLLPPTRSLARAQRELQGMPGGGGTPLASGIAAGLEQAVRSRMAGRAPLLVILTDGGANIARDGTPGRPQAQADAEAVARLVAAARLPAILIDSSPRGDARVQALSDAMAARYVRLPRPEDRALARIVEQGA